MLKHTRAHETTDGSESIPPDDIAAAAERALQLEEFEDYFRSSWPRRSDQKMVMRQMVVSGIDSMSSLQSCVQGSGRLKLGEVLSQMGARGFEAETLEELQRDLDVRRHMRCELTEDGDRPILVTAPHNIFLSRDGQPSHAMEEYTTLIAQRISRQLGGSCLVWSRSEQYRSELNWFLAKKKGLCKVSGDYGLLLDPRNRDPNYLTTNEVLDNPWFREMSQQASKWSSSSSSSGLLHIDIHGCKDPPCNPSHLTVGLAAMRHEAEMGRSQLSIKDIERFGNALELELAQALNTADLQPRAPLVRVLIPSLLEAGQALHLSGAWPPSLKRHTQSQQAVSFAGFTHSCQLEISRSVRKLLWNDETLCRKLGKAINKAWQSVTAKQSPVQRSITRSVGTASMSVICRNEATLLASGPSRSMARTAPASLRRSCPARLRSRKWHAT